MLAFLFNLAIDRTAKKFGRVDIRIYNAAEQNSQEYIDQIGEMLLLASFRIKASLMFDLTQSALPHPKKQNGTSIINTTSVTAYRASPELLDYSASKEVTASLPHAPQNRRVEDNTRMNAAGPGDFRRRDGQ